LHNVSNNGKHDLITAQKSPIKQVATLVGKQDRQTWTHVSQPASCKRGFKDEEKKGSVVVIFMKWKML
jgi:hypothetical protein